MVCSSGAGFYKSSYGSSRPKYYLILLIPCGTLQKKSKKRGIFSSLARYGLKLLVGSFTTSISTLLKGGSESGMFFCSSFKYSCYSSHCWFTKIRVFARIWIISNRRGLEKGVAAEIDAFQEIGLHVIPTRAKIECPGLQSKHTSAAFFLSCAVVQPGLIDRCFCPRLLIVTREGAFSTFSGPLMLLLMLLKGVWPVVLIRFFLPSFC